MLEALTGTGLAASAGLNAYIPLLTVGLLGRYTDAITLPATWQWLENPWVIGILVLLLAVEVVADKIPAASGGLVFGAASSAQTATVTDPAAFFESNQWLPVVSGILIALSVHGIKATARAGVNAVTLGVGAPIVSTVEDIFAASMSLAAILLPLLVLAFLIVLILIFWWGLNRRRRRKSARLAARAGY